MINYHPFYLFYFGAKSYLLKPQIPIKLVCVVLLIFSYSFTKAQTLQVGIYTGESHFFNYPLFFLGGTTSSVPVTVWDNEVFARFEYKRISVETAYGPFFRKNLFGDGETHDSPSSTVYDYHLKDEFNNWQWQMLIQYEIHSFFSNKLKCFAGLSFTAIYEKATRNVTLTNVSDSSDVQKVGVSLSTLCPYWGADIMAEYKLSKHIQLSANLDFRVESDNLLYHSGEPFFYSALPTAATSVLIGISYLFPRRVFR